MNPRFPHGDPHAVVQAILADPRFHGGITGAVAGPDLLAQFIMWIGERLSALLHGIGRLLGSQSVLNSWLGIAVLAGAFASLAFLLIRFLQLPGRRYGPRPAAARTLAVESSAELIAQALAAAREERWHAAASALVRAAMRALDERGRLRFDPARTPREARRALRDRAFDAFEREAMTALYAAGAATADRFARLQAAYSAAFA